jgi:hypothetical protein
VTPPPAPHDERLPWLAMALDACRMPERPSCCSSGLAEGARHSPMGLPLPSVCSMSTVSMPRRASSRAALAPAGPPPSTATVALSDLVTLPDWGWGPGRRLDRPGRQRLD